MIKKLKETLIWNLMSLKIQKQRQYAKNIKVIYKKQNIWELQFQYLLLSSI
jgi:hypothetical protein